MKLKISIYTIVLCMVSITYIGAQTQENDSIQTKVDVGYGKQAKWKVSSAISTVNGGELNMFTSNLSNTLYGQIPGLTVTQQGSEPGYDSPSLFGRGMNTFGPGNDILVMVDGFQSSYEQLVPEEIETISFLKDASATAIYGNRGANGVLLITTKRGFDGPLKISFNTQHGFQSPQRLPQFLGSYDYARLFNEGSINDGNSAFYSESDLENYRTGSDPDFYPDVNWYDEILKNSAYMSKYNLNFRGGTNSVRYFVLLNYLNQDGLYINAGDLNDASTNSDYSRFNFRSNIEINVSESLLATVILGGSVEDKLNPSSITTSPMFNNLAILPPNSFPVYNPDGSFGGSSRFGNPVGDLLETGSYSSNGRTLQSTLQLRQKLDFITDGLAITGSVSFNNYFRSFSSKTKQYERFAINKNEQDETVYTGFGQNTSLVGNEGNSDQWRNTVFQGSLNYDRVVEKHEFSAMLMAISDSYTNISSSLRDANLSFPFRHIGGGGRFTYTNSQKYIGEFSFGYMGSENFPESNRFGFFPAVSLGWIASNESFLKTSNFMTFLKLRGSVGLTGNSNISSGGSNRFLFDQRYPYTASYYLSNTNSQVFGIAEGPLANPNVSWEKGRKMNFGIDMTILDRVVVSADIFENRRSDILTTPNRTVPQYLGVTLPLLNDGEVRNRGFEFSTRFNSKPSSELTYSIQASVWSAKNEIIFNSEPIRLYEYQQQTGRQIGQPFGLVALGLFKDQSDIDNSPTQIFTAVQPGDIKYKDLNSDGVIDQQDAGPIGNTSVPITTYSLSSKFNYKGFDFSFLLQAVTGRTVYFGGSYFHAFQNNGQVSDIALGRWTPETASTADFPRLSASNNLNNYRYSSFWQRDGSFVKLRNVEIGYTLPVSFLSKVSLTGARIYVNGTNLFSIDSMNEYIDPETNFGYPAMSVLSLGVNLDL
ncbi:SusC/RagA family TonB-linked outer membrane protein [Algoriphagus antarcticus]|uniref:TonB-linked SusC/RagA family outer membrane protein n=1 Tax=Algoriphagus antarcticus TaxID=238540 RepID=A0A3E0DW18_9BACT|nr:TonB-dependent receptor [Algoriphagus antarcticus]REG90282.1 TonB-linked SusC/RagA family outer membrane protein [Algoriphagus antarcticus]